MAQDMTPFLVPQTCASMNRKPGYLFVLCGLGRIDSASDNWTVDTVLPLLQQTRRSGLLLHRTSPIAANRFVEPRESRRECHSVDPKMSQ